MLTEDEVKAELAKLNERPMPECTLRRRRASLAGASAYESALEATGRLSLSQFQSSVIAMAEDLKKSAVTLEEVIKEWRRQ